MNCELEKELYRLYTQHSGITTDSRNCPADSIFLALKGESFDGNQFAAQALEKGCAVAIVDNPAVAVDDRYVLVDDCLAAYKAIAREHRRQFDIPVLAVTGTNGKTTTKELIAAVLKEEYNVLYTEGNFNNDIGVPKTLLRLTAEHDIAVIEMGASHPGDIKTLAETAEPTCGLITNVGRAHLEGFGSFEGVVRTKTELYDYLRTRDEGLVFINVDDEVLMDCISDDDTLWLSPYTTDPAGFSDCISGILNKDSQLMAMKWREPLALLEQEQRSTKWHKVQTHLVGAYNIYNVLAAVAVGINFGLSHRQICHALESYVPTNNRSQLVETASNRLIVDAYNANPSSMAAALDNFSLVDAPKKMAVLGSMLELGSESRAEHQRVVDRLAQMNLDALWLVGHEFGSDAVDLSQLPGVRVFADVNEVKAAIEASKPEGYTILIKGSNGKRLFELPPLL